MTIRGECGNGTAYSIDLKTGEATRLLEGQAYLGPGQKFWAPDSSGVLLTNFGGVFYCSLDNRTGKCVRIGASFCAESCIGAYFENDAAHFEERVDPSKFETVSKSIPLSELRKLK
jgi:hypothetical protein